MSNTIKNVWVSLFVASVLTVILCWPAAHKCEQCGKPALWEVILAHVVGDGYSMIYLGNDPVEMLHIGCAKDWMASHPLELDEEGRIISVYDPRHSSNK